jgi:D-cysteine desulfhydrase
MQLGTACTVRSLLRRFEHFQLVRGERVACRQEELQTTLDVAMATGIIMDPVYSGKAVHGMLHHMRKAPEEWEGARVLFIHTGGLLGMFDKAPQLQSLVESLDRSHRLEV